MRFLLITIFYVGVISGVMATGGDKSPCMTCEELKNLRLPEVTIREAVTMPPGSTAAPREKQSYCKVLGTIGEEINFELLLPQKWNGRFVMGGGGGFVGYIMNRAKKMVHSGYATVGTDTGHKGTDASWALNHMERQLNFGHLAVHRTAVTAKTLIFYYYGSDPEYSYFIGLSRGGGQGMMEAQRYPDDFDGIVAGEPAFDWVGMAGKFIENTKYIYPDPGDMRNPVITRDNLVLLEKSIFEKCDVIDGVKDSILNDPRDCNFKLEEIPVCPDGQSGKNCFTKEQMEAIKRVYAALTTEEGTLHPGFPFGGENDRTGWRMAIVGPKPDKTWPTTQSFYGVETFRYLIFNDPDWDYAIYDLEHVIRDTRYASAYLDATNTDYSKFKERGGKMIIYAGWADPLISALDVTGHYEQSMEKDHELSDYIRLYMLPGVTHIGGRGPGKVDWFPLIRAWVEEGKVPDRVIASKVVNGRVVRTRPVFPYPARAKYTGGDPDKAGSFVKENR
jgi:feruloyl esterase